MVLEFGVNTIVVPFHKEMGKFWHCVHDQMLEAGLHLCEIIV